MLPGDSNGDGAIWSAAALSNVKDFTAAAINSARVDSISTLIQGEKFTEELSNLSLADIELKLSEVYETGKTQVPQRFVMYSLYMCVLCKPNATGTGNIT